LPDASIAGKYHVGEPFSITEKEGLSIHALIQFIHLLGNPMQCIMKKTNSLVTVFGHIDDMFPLLKYPCYI